MARTSYAQPQSCAIMELSHRYYVTYTLRKYKCKNEFCETERIRVIYKMHGLSKKLSSTFVLDVANSVTQSTILSLAPRSRALVKPKLTE